MQLGDKKLIVQRATMSSKGGLIPAQVNYYYRKYLVFYLIYYIFI